MARFSKKKTAEIQAKRLATRAANARKKEQGHGLYPPTLDHGPDSTRKIKPKALAKRELNELARVGAEAKLKKLEAECEKLRMFLGFRAPQLPRGPLSEKGDFDVELP